MNNDNLQQIENEGYTFATQLLGADVSAHETYDLSVFIAAQRHVTDLVPMTNERSPMDSATNWRRRVVAPSTSRKWVPACAFMAGVSLAIERHQAT